MMEPQPIIDPEAIWIVTFFIRTGYIDVEVQAGNEAMAETFARGSLRRDGYNMSQVTLTGIKRRE